MVSTFVALQLLYLGYEREEGRRYSGRCEVAVDADYQRSRGNDPAVGLRLPRLLESAWLTLEAFRGSCRTRLRSPGERGPSWAARSAMEQAGIATAADLERWAREIEILDAQPRQPRMISCGFVAVGRLDAH